jgi:hypothetical protein
LGLPARCGRWALPRYQCLVRRAVTPWAALRLACPAPGPRGLAEPPPPGHSVASKFGNPPWPWRRQWGPSLAAPSDQRRCTRLKSVPLLCPAYDSLQDITVYRISSVFSSSRILLFAGISTPAESSRMARSNSDDVAQVAGMMHGYPSSTV